MLEIVNLSFFKGKVVRVYKPVKASKLVLGIVHQLLILIIFQILMIKTLNNKSLAQTNCKQENQ